ncbi:hypothetical protein [Bdellovibrio sp. BCCA]|uniref:hypothetical protein n=1 Tax=Bdellovibrio sp. BCCA TaxID=3136281 RepID=UPI0030F0B7EA
MKNTKQIFTTILTLSAVAFLTACGSSNQVGSSDLSSRVTPTGNTSSSTKPLAYCNQASGSDITAKLRAYVDSSNNVRMDYAYARLTALPATFKSDQTYIAMWKWMTNTSGATYLDPTPLQFLVANASTGQVLTAWKTTLRWSDVVTIASGMGITDPQTFFNSVNILVDLKDTQGEYDVLRISNYDLSTNKMLNQVDGLLPLFYANPADYAFEATGATRATVLQNLHPFKNYKDQGYSAAQFTSMAQGLCF